MWCSLVVLVFAGIAHTTRPSLLASFFGRGRQCNIYLSFGVDKQKWERREGHRRHQERPPELHDLRRPPHDAFLAAFDVCKMNDDESRQARLSILQGLQWLDQTAVKTVRAPDRTARFGTP